jgi:SAM-dependent methyltransferase
MAHYEPKHPFDGYEEQEAAEYAQMMEFIIRHEGFQAEKAGRWLAERLKPKSVIDIGCGPGIYLLPFKAAGAKVHGIDACSIGGECLDKGEFERWDLRFPYAPKDGKKYDLAICMEVAEHLERHWAERLIYTVTDCADMVLWSAAVPGQGGSYHVNEQPVEFWMEMFKREKGFIPHPLQDEMRAYFATFFDLSEAERGNRDVSGWFVNQTYLLYKDPSL